MVVKDMMELSSELKIKIGEDTTDGDEDYSLASLKEFKKLPDSIKQEKIKMNPSRQLHMREIIDKIGAQLS